MLITSGSRTMEKLAGITHVVLDKTGTLTEGHLQVSSAYLADNAPPKDVCCRLLAAAEVTHAQDHPAAKAVFQWALQNLDEGRRNFLMTTNVRIHDATLGRGVRCEVELNEGAPYVIHIGSKRFLEENAVDTSGSAEETHAIGSSTMVYLAFNEEYAGYLVLQVSMLCQWTLEGYLSCFTGYSAKGSPKGYQSLKESGA